nr:hypothetical protein [Candidatus Sigynarchaeota archaeon]
MNIVDDKHYGILVETTKDGVRIGEIFYNENRPETYKSFDNAWKQAFENRESVVSTSR